MVNEDNKYTAREIAENTGLSYEQVQRRMVEVVRSGKVAEVGTKKVKGQSYTLYQYGEDLPTRSSRKSWKQCYEEAIDEVCSIVAFGENVKNHIVRTAKELHDEGRV